MQILKMWIYPNKNMQLKENSIAKKSFILFYLKSWIVLQIYFIEYRILSKSEI